MRCATCVVTMVVTALMTMPHTISADATSVNEPGINLVVYNASTNNVVEGTIIANTWDPDDALTISGRVWEATAGCEEEDVIANADSIVVWIEAPDDPSSGPGHTLCGAPAHRRAFSPGTDSNGDYSVTIDGGGVSFLTDPGEGYCGARVYLLFKEGSGTVGRVVCGRQEDWPDCFPCDDAPAIYGVLASPDLVGIDLTVDASDLSQFTVYFGKPITKVFGWQADFNHTGGNVDASDFSYFAGRWGKNCESSKAGVGSGYQMDVRNLLVPEIEEFMATHSITKSQVVAIWEESGWTYDHEAATAVLAGAPVPLAGEPMDWGKVKVLYR